MEVLQRFAAIEPDTAINLHGVYITPARGQVKIIESQFILDFMMFNTELCYAGHSRRFTLDQAPLGGWELKIEEDHAVVSRVLYSDWHRVERALRTVTRRVSELEAGGWRAISNPSSLITDP